MSSCATQPREPVVQRPGVKLLRYRELAAARRLEQTCASSTSRRGASRWRRTCRSRSRRTRRWSTVRRGANGCLCHMSCGMAARRRRVEWRAVESLFPMCRLLRCRGMGCRAVLVVPTRKQTPIEAGTYRLKLTSCSESSIHWDGPGVRDASGDRCRRALARYSLLAIRASLAPRSCSPSRWCRRRSIGCEIRRASALP